jgi:hypothetical protein
VPLFKARCFCAQVFEEYRRFASGKRRLQNEQFIELFDVDLVRVLPQQAPAFLQFSGGSRSNAAVVAGAAATATPGAKVDFLQAAVGADR